MRASLIIAFLSRARAVDHHLLEYGVGLNGVRCALIEFHMAVFKAVSVWLNISVSLMEVGLGRLSRFILTFECWEEFGLVHVTEVEPVWEDDFR